MTTRLLPVLSIRIALTSCWNLPHTPHPLWPRIQLPCLLLGNTPPCMSSCNTGVRWMPSSSSTVYQERRRIIITTCTRALIQRRIFNHPPHRPFPQMLRLSLTLACLTSTSFLLLLLAFDNARLDTLSEGSYTESLLPLVLPVCLDICCMLQLSHRIAAYNDYH